MKRIITAMLCVVMALCMFGCGQSNEEKYTVLKNEVLTAMTSVEKINKELGSVALSKKEIPRVQKACDELKPFAKTIETKMKEMKEISKKDLKLTNDFTDFEHDMNVKIKLYITRKESVLERLKKL